jgi:hypothetical protein
MDAKLEFEVDVDGSVNMVNGGEEGDMGGRYEGGVDK